MVRPRLTAALLAIASLAAAQPGESAAALAAAVRSAIGARRADKDIAKLVRKAKLAESLDDTTIEVLESQGAGPRAVEELERQRDLSRALPPPAASAASFEAPPAPSAEERSQILNQAGRIAMNYTRSLPDFLCTETVRRYVDTKGKDSWDPTDILTIRLAYSAGQAEDYKLIAVNGRKTFRTYEEVGGALTKGEFASILHHLFTASARTRFHWEHWTLLRKRPTYVFSYQIEPENSAYRMDIQNRDGRYSATLGQHGLIYVDHDSGQVVRIVVRGDHFPPDFPVQRSSSVLDYDFIDVGGRQFLLPLRADVRMVIPTKMQTRNLVEFEDYRKFSTETTITFDKQ
jgi:hypothetical protein